MASQVVSCSPAVIVDPRQEESTDFSLADVEVAKGSHAYQSFLDSIRLPERRRVAADALDTLALVITAGKRLGSEFPWHQVRAHHGTAALSLLRESGVPARVESYFCHRDQNRKLRRAPEVYLPRQVQQIRGVLRRMLLECSALGYAEVEETDRVTEILRPGGNTVARGRMLTHGEFRALISVCAKDKSPRGCRDNIILRLGYEGGLRMSELASVRLDDLKWNDRSGAVRIRVRAARGQRGRWVPLSNDGLIAVEDWLELRGREAGSLLRPISRSKKVEHRRLSGADIRLVCNRRAEQAGVELFSPQDLRRRVAEGGLSRHSNRVRQQALSLFGDKPEELGEERLSFPYRG